MTELAQRITKIDAARREINAGIVMYLNDIDILAIHAVVAGGLQIVTDLAHAEGKKVGEKEMLANFKPEYRTKMRLAFRHPQNFLKHADREDDHEAVLEYRPETLEAYVMMACLAYEDYTDTSTPEIRTFMFSMYTEEPDLLLPGEYKDSIMSYISTNPERMTKQALLEMIKTLRIDRPVGKGRLINFD